MVLTEARWPGRLAAVGCAVFLALLVMMAHPFAELGVVDDWSYAYSANVLAETGHVVYNGWGAMPLTWVLYWGALFIRLFGFSFFALRCSMLLVSMATVFVVHRTLHRSGISEKNSTVATLAILLSPPFFSVCFLYMSDIPGMLALVLCLYGVLRVLETGKEASATNWLVFAAISNTVLGSTRQIALLGVLLMVPAAAWRLRRSVRFRVFLPVWLLCIVGVLGLLHWFAVQPYTVREGLFPATRVWRRLGLLVRVPVAWMFHLAPLMVLFLFSLRWRDRRLRIGAGIFAAALVGFYFLLIWMADHGQYVLILPYLRDTFTPRGFHDLAAPMGEEPVLLGLSLRVALSCLTLLLLTGAAVYLLFPGLRAAGVPPVRERIRRGQLRWILLPFFLAYSLLFATRTIPFDRYLMPLTLLAGIAVLRFLERNSGWRNAFIGVVAMVVLLGWMDVSLLHDEFSLYRARVQAADQLVRAGIPRDHIYGGFEYDGWTEIEKTGYIKDPRLKLKPGEQAFDPTLEWVGFPGPFYTRGYMPSIIPDYVITHSLYPTLERSSFPDVTYRTWTTPGTWPLMVARMKQPRKKQP